MINLVIVAHGDLGDALIRATEMIAGPSEGLFAVSLRPGESPEGLGDKLAAALRPIEGQETILLIDLFGGTPYNVAARQILKENVECVTGVNLPILLELVMARDNAASLAALAESITQKGQQSIRNLGPMLRGKEATSQRMSA